MRQNCWTVIGSVILRSKSIFKGLNLDFQSLRGVLEQQEVSLPAKTTKRSVENQNVNRYFAIRRVVHHPAHRVTFYMFVTFIKTKT